MVRAIRTFRPDVLIARFSGTSRDGHAHHQASALLTVEAIAPRVIPTNFPTKSRKVFCPGSRASCMWVIRRACFRAATWQRRLHGEAQYRRILAASGMSTRNSLWKGLSHQTSQGTGGIRVPPGPRYTYYKLTDSTIPKPAAHENDFFDGIDTSLVGLASRWERRNRKFLSCALRLSHCKDMSMTRAKRFLCKILLHVLRRCLQGEMKQKNWCIRWKIRSLRHRQRPSYLPPCGASWSSSSRQRMRRSASSLKLL